jgi:hypothetical protein
MIFSNVTATWDGMSRRLRQLIRTPHALAVEGRIVRTDGSGLCARQSMTEVYTETTTTRNVSC